MLSLYSTLLSFTSAGIYGPQCIKQYAHLDPDKRHNTSYSGKECAVTLLGIISRMRPMDIGNMLSDIVAVLLKLVKNSASTEVSLKLIAVQALNPHCHRL